MSFAGAEKDEFVTSLAVLALYDGGAEITSDQINTLIAATNNTVAPYWPTLFASNIGTQVADIIKSRGAGGVAAPAAAAGAAPGGAAPAADAAPAAAPKPKVEEVDALEGGMDMFGGGGGGDY